MESLPSVSTSIVPSLRRSLHFRRSHQIFLLSSTGNRFPVLYSFLTFPPSLEHSKTERWKTMNRLDALSGDGNGDLDENDSETVERAIRMDGAIPGTSDGFVKQVSSRAYDMRRKLEQSIDSSTYDVLETNPWRGDSKPVYVLTQRENQLWTMKTRRTRSEVERELGLLFSRGGRRRSEIGSKAKQPRTSMKFHMLVEDIREGILVFEDELDAVRYCDILQGGGQGCDGVAELEASSVFDICHKMRGLAVLFRRGRIPPQPESLQLNLKARKRSLEDQEDMV